ncbi:carbon monoxide dehydrogenase [Nakamurella silvestris]|nr:carbon monoxide dehydrogenase [Nakamurella silvestris]
MKVAGTSVLHATPEKVWAAITDPAVLAGVIPGCNELAPLGENHFALTVTLGVASIKGSYAGEVRLNDLVVPSSLTMVAAGSGGPGTIDTTVAVTLADLGDGTTELTYDADAVVGGMVGGVGQRVLTSVAKKTAGLFFSAIDDVLTGKKVVLAQAAAVPADSGVSVPAATVATGFGRPADGGIAVAPGGANPFSLIGAALFGAITMLIGVLVGARIGRRP